MADKPQRPGRFIFRLVAALGLGLGAAALWWEYSDVALAKIGPLLEIEKSTNDL